VPIEEEEKEEEEEEEEELCHRKTLLELPNFFSSEEVLKYYTAWKIL
jgi:hypothetical protein